MSKTKPGNTERPAEKEPCRPMAAAVTKEDTPFAIPTPWLLLLLLAVAVYLPSLHYGLTELDDSIFIRDFHAYNENLQNLVTSFQRGLFDAVKDPYYRPLFMDSMILNYAISDHGQEIASYHFINIALHAMAVVLLYQLFLRLKVSQLHAFLLSAVFAVHPVLSQAVAWIPGRNDTLLAIFVFSFLICSIKYVAAGKPAQLALSALFLLLAYFTKETAVFAAPVAFVLLVLVLREQQWNSKRNLALYAVWLVCFVAWYAARVSATIQTNISIAQVLHDFLLRVPLIVQYLGKVILPVNLSVFPIQQDTVYYWGVAALALLVALVAMSKDKKIWTILAGAAVFLLFLLPVLFVPSKLNEQSFEHRLYLPMVGILLLLSQTALLRNKLKDKQQFIAGMLVCGILAVVNFSHQKAFADRISFWTQAVETSPHSAFANMMLAARLDKEDFEKSCNLFRTAYALNPNEKYLNFYMGVMLQKKDSVMASEPYLLKEKNTSGYYECDFYLARVAMEKKDLAGAIKSLEAYLQKDPNNGVAHNNLLLLYIDTQQLPKAKEHVRDMQKNGLAVPKEFMARLGM